MKRIKTFILALAASIFTATAQTDEITVHDDQNDRDEVIDLPEGMSVSCDSLINEWMAKKYLYPDTTCTNPDYNPTFTTEEYQERLRRLPVVMEMPYNSVVQKFIDQYSGRLRRTVSYALGAGNFYIPIFEEALDYYGLPLELKYLPVIESALEPKAKSPAGAVGLWQFMLATGKRYDLKVNSLIDERQDPYKSSWAAARYLRDLYKIYRDWSLVIAAYNCGPGNVNKAIHRANGVRDYWTIYPYLPSETRGYVPAFIAANYIMNYYCEHNICPMKTKLPVTTDTVTITRDLHMQQVAELCNIEVEAIKALNPQYRTQLIPGSSGPMTLCLPTETLNAFIDLKDSVYNYRADELMTRRSNVEVNDKLDHRSVAARRRASRSSSADNESSTTTSHSSRSSSRSSRSSSSRSSKTSKRGRNSKSSRKESSKSATVRSGDTLIDIARRNGTTVEKLKKKNKIKGSMIKPGQKLKVR
ncbi:MAG: transglycosylase SLT domain-containing protein [Prevotella sp.]|nr:transglycosylase SLT domain-containing protein [Prevotella sp.]MDY5666015.1 transglycosylase SLT domain-containing protein [Alloprevotella sp.]